MTYEERLRQVLDPGRALYSRASSYVVRMLQETGARLPGLLDAATLRLSRGIGVAESAAVRVGQFAKARRDAAAARDWERPLILAIVGASLLLAWFLLYAVHALSTQLVALVTDMINQALSQLGYPSL
jgi:hypothetical protein